MWYLSSENKDPRILYVLPQKDMVIGRNADSPNCFVIQDDTSISRTHATLTVNAENHLFIKDMGSRYGTFVNNSSEKLEQNVMTQLQVNDVVKFGKLHSTWKVHCISLSTCTSTITGPLLETLRLTLGKLGGTVKSEWDDTCAYLTMPTITLTVKVVLALAQGSHIVTIDFWNKCLEAVYNQTRLPDPNKFTPKVAESTLNKENTSFLPNTERSKLFIGKKFVFFSKKQFDMYRAVLTKTCAKPLLISQTKMTKSQLSELDVVVIQYTVSNVTQQETQNQKNQIDEIVNYLKSKGKRVVADAEIGLAILYCSTNKYCNPEFQFSNEVLRQSDQTKKPTILAQESQEQQSKCKGQHLIIDESLTPNKEGSYTDNTFQSKRKVSEDDDIQTNPNKKLATDNGNSAEINIETSKRKSMEDSDEKSGNPSKKIAIAREDLSDGEDGFNFTKPTSPNDKGNKIFSKVQKRKAPKSDEEDDDLFNFIQDNSKDTSDGIQGNKKQSLFDVNRKNNGFDETNKENKQSNRRIYDINSDEVSAMRGIKLKELMQNLSSTTYNTEIPIKSIKKEDISELDGKFNNLDLGETIIKVRNDLIVKKEPVWVTERENTTVKNFKKFKKVWPVNMHSRAIPKASMNTTTPVSL